MLLGGMKDRDKHSCCASKTFGIRMPNSARGAVRKCVPAHKESCAMMQTNLRMGVPSDLESNLRSQFTDSVRTGTDPNP